MFTFAGPAVVSLIAASALQVVSPLAPGNAAGGQAASTMALVAWRNKLDTAKALPSESERRDAFLALLREALTGRQVELSGTSVADHVDPVDNRPAPIVNFDMHLQEKKSFQANPAVSARSLATNFGYYFTAKRIPYVVIGPAALDPRGPVFTRMAAEHELYHAEHHVGDPRPLEDRELETWTAMFVNYFADVHTFRQRWAPMVAYYDDASPVERKIALDKLLAYRASPPASQMSQSDSAAVRAAFDEWLGRRRTDPRTAQSRLVADLEKAIGPS